MRRGWRRCACHGLIPDSSNFALQPLPLARTLPLRINPFEFYGRRKWLKRFINRRGSCIVQPETLPSVRWLSSWHLIGTVNSGLFFFVVVFLPWSRFFYCIKKNSPFYILTLLTVPRPCHAPETDLALIHTLFFFFKLLKYFRVTAMQPLLDLILSAPSPASPSNCPRPLPPR